MGGLSIWHWMIVLVVVLLLFGTGKVSNLMGEFGKGIKTFKQNVASEDEEKQDAKMSGMGPGTGAGTGAGTGPGTLNPPPLSEQTKTTVNQG